MTGVQRKEAYIAMCDIFDDLWDNEIADAVKAASGRYSVVLYRSADGDFGFYHGDPTTHPAPRIADNEYTVWEAPRCRYIRRRVWSDEIATGAHSRIKEALDRISAREILDSMFVVFG